MREVEKRDSGSITANNSFDRPFTNDFIQEKLNIKHKDFILFKNGMSNIFNDKNNVLSFYKEYSANNRPPDVMSNYEICDNFLQIKNLYCLNEIKTQKKEYYYFPSKSKKIDYIDKDMDFYCYGLSKQTPGCTFMYITEKPYNMILHIVFDRPKDFFISFNIYSSNHWRAHMEKLNKLEFTQSEINSILNTFENIKSRMNIGTSTSLDPNDRPIADGYAMMANLLKNRLITDKRLSNE